MIDSVLNGAFTVEPSRETSPDLGIGKNDFEGDEIPL